MRQSLTVLAAGALVLTSCVMSGAQPSPSAQPSGTHAARDPTSTAAPGAAPVARTGDPDRYVEDFSDGWVDDWELRGGFAAQGGALAATGPALGHYRFGTYWQDSTLRLRVKHIAGEVRIHYRVYWQYIGTGYWVRGYEIVLGNGRIELSRFEFEDRQPARDVQRLASAPLQQAPESWRELRIESSGASLRVSLDERALIDVTDDAALLEGSIGLEVPSGGHALIDDIEVHAVVHYEQTWTRTAGPEGAMVSAIAIDPVDPRVVYAGTGHSGLYISPDRGRTWRQVVTGITKTKISSIEIAPSDRNVVYVGHLEGGGGSRSGDAGRHWSPVRLGDEGHVNAFAIHPRDPRVVYAGLGSSESPQHTTAEDGVYVSRDGGATWDRLTLGQRSVFTVRISPSQPDTIWAGGAGGVWKSDDAGATWSDAGGGLGEILITQIVLDPTDPLIAYARQDQWFGPVFKTTTGGRSWRQVLDGSHTLAASPVDPRMLYATVQGKVLLTGDGAVSWIETTRERLPGMVTALAVDPADTGRMYAGLLGEGVFISSDGGRSWDHPETHLLGDLSEALAIDPGDRNVVYAGHSNGYVSKTVDGGESWRVLTQLGQGGPPDHVTALAVRPGDPETVFVANLTGVHRSRDAGATWHEASAGMADPRIISLALDPREPDRMYAGTGSSRPYSIFTGTGLYRSTDGGDSWARAAGLPQVAVPSIAVSPSDPRVLYIAAMGRGVYRSADGGGTWSDVSATLANPFVYVVAVHPTDPNVVYAGTQLFYGAEDFHAYEDQKLVDGVYKSADGGSSWRLLRESWVENIVIDPVRPESIYYNEHSERIWHSPDGGRTWELATKGLVPWMAHVYVYHVVIDPTGTVLYATTCGLGVYRNLVRGPEE